MDMRMCFLHGYRNELQLNYNNMELIIWGVICALSTAIAIILNITQ